MSFCPTEIADAIAVTVQKESCLTGLRLRKGLQEFRNSFLYLGF